MWFFVDLFVLLYEGFNTISSLLYQSVKKKIQKHSKGSHVPIIKGLHFLFFFSLSYLSLSLLVWTWKFIKPHQQKQQRQKPLPPPPSLLKLGVPTELWGVVNGRKGGEAHLFIIIFLFIVIIMLHRDVNNNYNRKKKEGDKNLELDNTIITWIQVPLNLLGFRSVGKLATSKGDWK